MIYLDNAATTLPKPPEVAQAVTDALATYGGVGRGVHPASMAAGMGVYRARSAVARLLGASSAAQVSFCTNATEALNTALLGLLRAGDRAVTTAASHNSMLRPLYRLRTERGVELAVAPIGSDGSLDLDRLRELVVPGTRLVAVTHASNLTGDVYNIEAIARIAHEAGALLVADVAQTAGTVPISLVEQGLDVVCFTGHKGLYGPQGTGGLAVAEGLEIDPLLVGGSGFHSYDEEHPSQMPDRLEAGTLNGHGIAGLGAGASFVAQIGVEAIAAHERTLVRRFEEAVAGIPDLRLYGSRDPEARCGIVALNLGERDSAEVAAGLAERGICVRSGAHCAPLMHRALGTQDQGAVRLSFSWFNTAEEVDEAARALEEIARQG